MAAFVKDHYYWRLVRAFGIFFGFQLLLAVLVFGMDLAIEGQRPKWLDVSAGTLTFPTLVYSGIEKAPTESKTFIHFKWWGRSAFDAPIIVWVLNTILWAAFLAWAFCSARAQSWVVGAVLFLGEIAFCFVCYSLFVTIEYSPEWRDFIGVFGTLATLIAFGIAIKQVGDAKRAAEASEVAAQRTANLYGSHYFAYAISEAKRLFSLCRSQQNQAKQTVNSPRWMLAAEYFTMTVDILYNARHVLPPGVAPNMENALELLRGHVQECERMGAGGKIFKQNEWTSLEQVFSKLILDNLPPLPQQVQHADNQ